MKRWRYVLLVLCTAVISISGTYLMTYFMRSEENKQEYEDISQIGFPETEADHEEENDQQDVKQSEDDFDYQSLVAINSDCVGWIQIPGTDINYPVVQAADNEFYLTHNFNRETAACGAIFMDYRNDVDAKAEHLILYGHNMRTRSMFGSLHEFESEDFYKKYNKIYLYQPEKVMKYTVYSVYDCLDKSTTYLTDFTGDKKDNRWMDWLSMTIEKNAYYPIKKKPKKDGQILTLSTCSGKKKGDDYRLVVNAVMK